MVQMRINFSDITIKYLQKLQEKKLDATKLTSDELCHLRQHGILCPNSEIENGPEVLSFIGVNLQQYLKTYGNVFIQCEPVKP